MDNVKTRKFSKLKFKKTPIFINRLFITLSIFLFVFSVRTSNQLLLILLFGLILIWLAIILKIEKIVIDATNNRVIVLEKSMFGHSKCKFTLSEFSALRIAYAIDKPTDSSNSNFGASPNWGKVQYRSFALYLVSDKKELKIQQFSEPAPAQHLQKELSKELNKPILKSIRIYQKN